MDIFFCKVANGRKRKNTIHSLECDPILIEGTKNLLAHLTGFYKDLFGPALGNLFHIDPNLWSADDILSHADNDDLSRPFTLEEVKNALFSMGLNRAPKPDSIPVEFY